VRLLEYEGKALLRANGVPVPAGALWPALPEVPSRLGWVVKAQVFQGHRGQRGGILVADDAGAVAGLAAKLSAMTIGGESVKGVYVEERVNRARELYLAALVDRDRGCVRIVASADGGMEIESVPAERIVSVEVDALIGLRPYQTGLLALKLGLAGETAAAFRRVATSVYGALVSEDAELVEINPLIVTTDGRLVAADAKVMLDDDAMSRHPARERPSEWQGDGAFMRRMRQLGAIGIDMRPHIRTEDRYRGTIAVLCNGAGVTMATFDLVTHLGGIVCGAVELHGALAVGTEHTASVVEGLRLVSPDVVMINGFYQLRPCDDFAQAIVDAIRREPAWIDPARVVVRMRGLKFNEALDILESAGCHATGSLVEACRLAVQLAARPVAEATR